MPNTAVKMKETRYRRKNNGTSKMVVANRKKKSAGRRKSQPIKNPPAKKSSLKNFSNHLREILPMYDVD